MATVKFNRSDLGDEVVLERVVRTGAPRHDARAVDAAGVLLRRQFAALRLSEPSGDAFAQFTRVLAAFPAAAKLLGGAHLRGAATAEEVENFYAIEEG